jgi:hypothetical protein
MEITCKPNNMQYLIVNNYKFEKVNEFKYLGTLITTNNNLTQINHRLLLANKCYYGLKKQLRSHYLSFQTKYIVTYSGFSIHDGTLLLSKKSIHYS